MEWFLITCHNSKPIGKRGLRVLRWTGVFFRGLGWDGDGGGGRERTSPPRLICRGTDELTGDRSTGDLDTQGSFTFAPAHFVISPSSRFLTKSKEPTGCRKLWEQKPYMRRFGFLTTYPAKKVPGGFEGWCIQRSPNMLTRISARDSRFLLLDCHTCIKRSLCSNHILIITLKNINELLHLVVTYCVNFVYWYSW